MHRTAYMLPVMLALLAGPLHAERDGDKRGGDKRRKRAEERLLNLKMRATKIAVPAGAAEPAGFLSSETQRLLDRARAFPPGSYEFDRILEAVDDLIDAREDLQSASRNEPRKSKEAESRDATAKRLERAYFRVQQGDYFAGLSADSTAVRYLPLSRQLYQRARAAYDDADYRRAAKLASASSELVNVLENLAQAAVRKPEPPVLK